MIAYVLGLSLQACTQSEPEQEPEVPSEQGTLVTSPEAPFVSPPEEQTGEGIDIDTLVEEANAAIALAASIEPDPVLAAYRDLAGGADPGCPAIYSDGDVDYWLDSCTSDAGTIFDGFGVDDTVFVDDGYSQYTVEATGGTARIEQGETWLEIDGFVQRIDSSADGVTTSSLVLTGRFDTNHPAASGSWLQDGLHPNLTTTTYDIGEIRAAFFIVGALNGLSGSYSAVAFDTCGIVDDSLGYGGCGEEPSGVLSMRQSDGGWVDIVFDPVGDEEGIVIDDMSLCDGCGTAWDGEEPLGTVCLDFSPWLP